MSHFLANTRRGFCRNAKKPRPEKTQTRNPLIVTTTNKTKQKRKHNDPSATHSCTHSHTQSLEELTHGKTPHLVPIVLSKTVKNGKSPQQQHKLFV